MKVLKINDMARVLIIIMLFSSAFIACSNKNQVDDMGLKTGYWKIHSTDSTYERGSFEKGNKQGKWEYFKSGNLEREVYYYSIKKDSIKREDRNYYRDNYHFLTERVINEQTVDVDVKIDSIYEQVYLYRNPLRKLGSDLFLYTCSSSGCHGGYPFVKDEMDIMKYSNADTLYKFVKTSNHGNWVDTIYARIDIQDIKAISKYINGPERKPIE